jgi:hypothetical protein
MRTTIEISAAKAQVIPHVCFAVEIINGRSVPAAAGRPDVTQLDHRPPRPGDDRVRALVDDQP